MRIIRLKIHRLFFLAAVIENAVERTGLLSDVNKPALM